MPNKRISDEKQRRIAKTFTIRKKVIDRMYDHSLNWSATVENLIINFLNDEELKSEY